MVSPISIVSHTSGKQPSPVGKFMQMIARDLRNQCGKREACAYLICIVLIYMGYIWCSDGIYSGIITLGSVIQCLGLCLNLLKVHTQRSANGISVKSLQLYALVYISRLSATLFHDGYLPMDRSGDWAYQVADIASLIVVFVLLWSCHVFGVQDNQFPVWICAAASLVLGWFIHPCHNLDTHADVLWISAVYLETFVMIPQLMLLSRRRESVEVLTSHSIACTFIYRFLNFWFWFSISHELVTEENPSKLPGYFLIGTLFIQVVMLIDFMYYYMKALIYSERLQLPMTIFV